MATKATKVKLSRQLGLPLTPKAIKGMERRPNPPGEHGVKKQRSPRASTYKIQLLEKQRLRSQYNISEKQMRNYVIKESRRAGDPTVNIIQALETRLDALVLRAGLARTPYAARQYISHRHIQINGKRVDIPSCRVKVGDVISVKSSSHELPCFIEAKEEMVTSPPPYLERTREEMSARLLRIPVREEIPISCLMDRVIEYYSR